MENPEPTLDEGVPEDGSKPEDSPEPPPAEVVDLILENKDRRRHRSAIITAWKIQQTEDRAMRSRYASWLMIVMSFQILAINIIFVLIGCGLLKFEPWTANVFITAVFAEISALVLLVVKYLFPASPDKSLDLLDRFRGERSRRSSG